MKGYLWVVFIGLALYYGCSDRRTGKEKGSVSAETSSVDLKHARKFSIQDGRVTVLEPWPGASAPITYSIPPSLTRVVCTSTTHLPYLEMLGVEETLTGFPGVQYISSEKIRKRVEEGKLQNVGADGRLNLELILSLQPDIVFAFDMGNESASLDKLTESGIQVVYNSDYLETSALGRAEWIKFFGAFYGKMAMADSIFNEIEATYDSLKILAKKAADTPTILSGVLYGDIWFLPGGLNSSARFFDDAGGEYLWSEDSTSGWLELGFESVFDKAALADYWIGVASFNSRREMAGLDARYSSFNAFKADRVYGYNKRISPTGGFDFFESGYARPDLVLADLIKILHPELLPEYETYYFQKLP